MKIETGKTYQTRNGGTATVVNRIGGGFRCDHSDGMNRWHNDQGIANLGDIRTIHNLKPTEFDLVENAESEILHPDDIAVDSFAAAMKAKLAKQRAKGYSGWEDKAACSTQNLQMLLLNHIAKGDTVDVGNFAMMLFNRGENTNNHLSTEKLLELYGDNMALHENSAGLKELLLNLQRSRNTYPLNNRMFDGLLGEVTELRRAYGGDGNVRIEALDVAVCAFRIAVEGDAGGNTLLEA